ncbi:MAG: hypothetical protein ACOCTI_00540 [Phycisphaeraceae bacterium]
MTDRELPLTPLMQLDLGEPLGQLRAAPVRLGGQRAMLLVHGRDADVDPFVEMFFYPEGTLKLTLVSLAGGILWQKDLGPGVVPGMWFCPFLAWDLDGDGVDEIYFVNNTDAEHPLRLTRYVLERLDARTGETTGQWPWPSEGDQRLSHVFRNFIVAGRGKAGDVLVTAQGTYGDMFLQGWDAKMNPLWERTIAADEPGARGSHMAPVVDIDGDGAEELLWGERCLRLDTGEELFCAARDSWQGHSDIIWPFRDEENDRWCFLATRESEGQGDRVAVYDDRGQMLWSDLDEGHMDMGWVAHLGENGRPVAMAIRIGGKSAGSAGRFHSGVEEFVYDALTGERMELDFSVYEALPVDLDGDGIDELVRGYRRGSGEVLSPAGEAIGQIRGIVAVRGRLTDHPGRQMLAFEENGRVTLWGAANGRDSKLDRGHYPAPLRNTSGYDLFYEGAVEPMAEQFHLQL